MFAFAFAFAFVFVLSCTPSKLAWEEMAEWLVMLSNGSPPYVGYQVAHAVCVLEAEIPGVRTLTCDDLYQHL